MHLRRNPYLSFPREGIALAATFSKMFRTLDATEESIEKTSNPFMENNNSLRLIYKCNKIAFATYYE